MVAGRNQEESSCLISEYQNHMTFSLTIGISFLDDKDRKTKRGVVDSELKSALLMHFIKGLVHKTTRIVAQRVNVWFYRRYF